jgi:hypothetical protein
VVLIAWSEAAEARPEAPDRPDFPERPAVPDRPPAPRRPEAPDRTCHWEIREYKNANDQAVLVCDPPVNHFREVPEEERPPLPANCEIRRPDGGMGDSGPEETAFCADAGKRWIYCRNQDGLFGRDWLDYAWEDEELHLQVPQSSPQWWIDEIEQESKDAADGKNGMGCRLAEHPPAVPCSERNTTDPSEPDYYRSEDGLVPDRCWGTYPSKH